MTGSLRKLGLATLALFVLSLAGAYAQDLGETFARGVSLMRRGKDKEALEHFQQILASDPSQDEAYELWKATDGDDWIDILTREGDFELFARDMMERTRLGRAKRQRDEDAIRALVAVVSSKEGPEARAAVRTLSADHGEFAVPQLVPFLADPGDDERRVRVMHALTQMDTDVVLPLIEAMESSDPYLRRNVAYVLGLIGDPRALPALAEAAMDDDAGVRAAGSASMERIGLPGMTASELYVQQGDDYHNRRESVLRPYQYSAVVWVWEDRELVPYELRSDLYNDELAKRAYQRALELDPSSVVARAGLVRAYVSQKAKVEELAALGEDVEELEEWIGEGQISVGLAGIDAIDGALAMAVGQNDLRTAVELCRTLAATSDRVTPGLEAALASGEAATSAEAAIAMGRIAIATGSDVPAEAVSVLGDAAGREILRIVAVIDSNAERAHGVVEALRDQGYLAYGWNQGAKGLAMMKRVPGVDAVFVGDQVADLTPFQVLDELERDPRTTAVPRLVLTAAEDAEELYGDASDGIVAGAGYLDSLEELLAANLNLERERADRLSVHAATALAHLARSGVDISAVAPQLTSTLAARPDEVTVPAMEALGLVGGAETVEPLIAVSSADARSDRARTAASRALALVFRRGHRPTEEGARALIAVVASDAALTVRTAAAYALGALDLDDLQRAEALSAMAVTAGSAGGVVDPDADVD